MFIPFIQTIMTLFGQIFMKFFTFPIGDLGFNLGTLSIFLILLKFAFRVILPELVMPTLQLGNNVKIISRVAVNVGTGVGRELASAYRSGSANATGVQRYKGGTHSYSHGQYQGGTSVSAEPTQWERNLTV